MDRDIELNQILIPKSILSTPSESSTQMDIERYIGIQHHFPDPYHIYLHVDDIKYGNDVPSSVRFIVYSMGKKKVVLAGSYNKHMNPQVHISHACRYSTRDLIDMINVIDQRFINTLNIMKNRIDKRVDQFAGLSSPPYLQDRNDYIQLKAWLSLQPSSAYYLSDTDVYRVQSAISTEYERRLRRSIATFELVNRLSNQYDLVYLSGDSAFDIQDDIDQLYQLLTQQLDNSLQQYESRLSIQSSYTRDKNIVDISKRIAEWLKESVATSDQWVRSLQQCQCINESDEGCQILSWGEDPLDRLL